IKQEFEFVKETEFKQLPIYKQINGTKSVGICIRQNRFNEGVGKNTNENINNSKKLSFYPGSPSIMSFVTDNYDKLSFYELHNNEYQLLRKNLSKQINAKAFNSDGFDFTNKKINSNEKTLVLIDPSYEIKDDFEKVVNTLKILDGTYSNLTAIIWYPVLNIENNDLFIE
ncbi:MAG: 23S rRNA (adenine(2030)-N(6))-methyltransferase RlmJ, partial [Candidatus Nitrosopelagicus sp.]|nr:23S rRNA (adenine(2030)-N(6))-methyltransferase RlmJ [Candidatus Nitrosopelagicus sp.]